jgi:hypothetical protein
LKIGISSWKKWRMIHSMQKSVNKDCYRIVIWVGLCIINEPVSVLIWLSLNFCTYYIWIWMHICVCMYLQRERKIGPMHIHFILCVHFSMILTLSSD